MSENRTHAVTAVILRSHDYGEGHRLYSLLTREEGKRCAIARGVRKPRAKLAASLQHFTLAEIFLARGVRYDVITQVRVLNPFYALRRSLEGIAYASYFCELFDESLADDQQHPELFDLLSGALMRLVDGGPFDLLARFVEMHLIAISGYLPMLRQCAHCRQSLARLDVHGQSSWPTWLGFSASQGGALCPACLPLAPGAKRIAAGTVQVMQRLLLQEFTAVEALSLSPRLRREIEATLREYLEYRLERRLQSVRFLHNWGETPEMLAHNAMVSCETSE